MTCTEVIFKASTDDLPILSTSHKGEWPRLPSTARDILTRPTPSAPGRALVPGDHSFIVRVLLRAERAPGRSPLTLRARSYPFQEGGVIWSPTAHINAPSKLARCSFHGMAPVLVPLRPSSEHILIVRAPGARDRHGCHATPCIVRPQRAQETNQASLSSLPQSLPLL